MPTWRIHHRDGRTEAASRRTDARRITQGWTWYLGMCILNRPRAVVLLRHSRDDVQRVTEQSSGTNEPLDQ